jgi:hypothetical protein
MAKATRQATGHDLVRDLSHLRNDEGMAINRVKRAPALLHVCGRTVKDADDARKVVITALDGMQDREGGRALKYMYNVDERNPASAPARRNAYAKLSGLKLEALLELEDEAIKELALRLLAHCYKSNRDSQTELPAYLISSLHVACIIRDRRVVETLQSWTVIPVVDGVREFEHDASPGAKLRDVHGGQVQTPAQDDQDADRLRHTIRFPHTLARGREYSFSFREIISWEADRLPRQNHYQRQFNGPVLRYQIGVRFFGEQPVRVWSYSCAAGDRTPGSFEPRATVHKSDTGYESVEFVDQCNRVSGVGWRWREPRLVYLIAGILILAAATLNWPELLGQKGNMVSASSVLIFATLFCAGVPLIYKYFAVRNRRRFKAIHHYNQLIQVPERAAVMLQRAAAHPRGITALQSAVFVTSILKPRQLRQRVTETYDLGRRTLKQRVTIEALVPSNLLFNGYARPQSVDGSAPLAAGEASSRPLTDAEARPILREELSGSGAGAESLPAYFAVLVPKKSRFHDDFSLFREDGAALPILSYREYLQLVASILRLSLAAAFDLQDPVTRQNVRQAELRALRLIMSRRTAGGVAPNLALGGEWHDGLKAPTAIHARRAWESALALVRKLTFHYAIVAVVMPDKNGRFWIGYERTLIPDLKLAVRDRFAVLVGARPVELSISIKSASTAQSYHLNVNGPEDSYLGKQYLDDSATTLEAVAKDEVVPPHYRFRRRLGQPHAHFYARFFPEPAIVSGDGPRRRENPQVRVKYFETPPGSLLRAVVSAIACVLLVGIIGGLSSRSLDPGTDAAAVLLVFPALVAAWLGFDSPSRGLLEGTIASRLSLLLTVLTSISASGLYMAHKVLTKIRIGDVERTYSWWKVAPEWSFLWIYDISWIAITLVALCNAIVIVYLYLSRTAYFAYLASRSDGSEVRQHG